MAVILLVDDDEQFLKATTEILEMLGHSVVSASTVSEACAIAKDHRFTHAILDLILPDGSGLHVLEILQQENFDLKIALVTGHTAVKSIVMNFYGPNISYLIKPIDLPQLQSLLEEPVQGESESDIKQHFNCLVGESESMYRLYEMIERVADAQANVMLLGESGVGKEVVACAIHYASNPEGAFVPANCGAFARDLINSELFGHEKGAFTGATHRRAGVFELANKGTLFLDEITEMPIDLQPSLLRVLETNQVTRLGATSPIDVHCRVVSATNRSENEIAQQGWLREDLYFRLAVFPIRVPSLREHKEDIPLLTRFFLSNFNRQYKTRVEFDDSSITRLMEYDWPGNIRELRHVVHRAFIMADVDEQVLRLPEDLGSPFSQAENQPSAGITVGKTVEDVERELIETTLEHFSGDKKKAAETLGISLKTLYNRLNSYAES